MPTKLHYHNDYMHARALLSANVTAQKRTLAVAEDHGKTRSLLDSDADLIIIDDDGRRRHRDLHGDRGRRQRRNDAAPVRDAMVIRVEFLDYGVSQCDEACAADIMWGTDGSSEHVSGLFDEASHGTETFPKPASGAAVYTVQIQKKMTKFRGCPFPDFAAQADKAMKKQHFINVDDHAHYQIYLLPEETALVGCKWDGLAYIACDPDPAFKSPCKSFLRSNPMEVGGSARQSLAHELGHNLGLHHSSTDTDDDNNVESEYGDEAGMMGIAPYWRSLNTPHRIEMGWVSEDDVQVLHFPSVAECASGAFPPRTFRLESLHSVPLATSGRSRRVSALKIARPAERGGGFYFMGYRARKGYDAFLPESFGERVHLHYQLGDSAAAKTSRLVAAVGVRSGEVKFDAGFSLKVESANSIEASVTLNRCSEPPSKAGGPNGECNGVTIVGVSTDTNEDVLNGDFLPNGVYNKRETFFNEYSSTHLYWIESYGLWAASHTLGDLTQMMLYVKADIRIPVNLNASVFVFSPEADWAQDDNVVMSCYVPTTSTTTATTTTVVTTTKVPLTGEESTISTSTEFISTTTSEAPTTTEATSTSTAEPTTFIPPDAPGVLFTIDTQASTAETKDGGAGSGLQDTASWMGGIVTGLVVVIGVVLFVSHHLHTHPIKTLVMAVTKTVTKAVSRPDLNLPLFRDSKGSGGFVAKEAFQVARPSSFTGKHYKAGVADNTNAVNSSFTSRNCLTTAAPPSATFCFPPAPLPALSMSRCGGQPLPVSADVRSTNDVTAFKGKVR